MHQSPGVTRGKRPGGLKTPRLNSFAAAKSKKTQESWGLRVCLVFSWVGSFACPGRPFGPVRMAAGHAPRMRRFCVVHASVMRRFCAVGAPSVRQICVTCRIRLGEKEEKSAVGWLAPTKNGEPEESCALWVRSVFFVREARSLFAGGYLDRESEC
jgi:hypothetical protein